MKVEHTETFRCPSRVLWSWIDDVEKSKQWLRGLEEVVPLDPGPKRPGWRAKLRIREGGRVQEYEQEIVDYEPGRRFHMTMEGGALKGCVIDVDYVLTDLGDGTTRLDYACGAKTNGVMRIFGLLFAIFGRLQLRSFFKKLKALAEGEARTGFAR